MATTDESSRDLGRADIRAHLDWALEDPAGKGVEAVRPIRDEIKTRIEALIAEIDGRRDATP